ncbi:hypothetical protein NCAS_0A06830 [Naumovozyma castellii]|uniref:ER membrane protein complex subunit 6 n=1 Tax=Naumovozyma castellii TaxID=27288 RepID=G0V6Z3_NAUCA|nr:hypothetical protein NCAS_0A06830 [Naumovozyma castellii CBS 4309]CCC67241.1 hypothetical protein NCAS_0A06830 [Naumovozyma castellii CBS 4309]
MSQAEDQFSRVRSTVNVGSNKKSLLFVQDSTMLIIGLGAGILQLESLNGFLMFAICYILVSIVFVLWLCEGKPGRFFENPIQDILMDSFFRELMGFIMAWTFSYALVG